MTHSNDFDVLVVGGGHAGCEAAAAAARRGARTALLTFDAMQIGAMSCNPAFGGLGKGHLVREIDALDGLMARAADAAAIHHRMLNASKGAAVRGPRIQADRKRYRAAMQELIAAQKGLTVIEGEAAALLLDGDVAVGLRLADGRALHSRAVVLATGTFLGGRLFRGEERLVGGRISEQASSELAGQLRALDLPMARLKTGTPPRLDGRTIDWGALDEQPSDGGGWTMSALTPRRVCPQLSCGITRTNARTHDIIRTAMNRSPLFSGDIEGRGPRYCPSIEDKVSRFADRDGHQIFLEPEGLDDPLIYPNGISTSLPTDVQIAMIRSIAGLERAEIVTPGYAVEYDHIDPRALDSRLALRAIPGVFCAGQINGTTGYEEAGAQGLVAGANAAAHALSVEPLSLERSDAYLGVMIDDLVLQGVSEPYRMLTARAEYRLQLRADNAEVRLGAIAMRLGLMSDERRCHFDANARARSVAAELGRREYRSTELQAYVPDLRDDGARRSMSEWVRFPRVGADVVRAMDPQFAALPDAVVEEFVEEGRYAPYVERQQSEIRAVSANAAIKLPETIDYSMIGGLSTEMIERLNAARPENLGAAERVRGVTPAAIAAILVYVQRLTKAAA